jgi:hypothetical protein
LQRAYADSWRRQFAPRLRLAAVFAHLAMRPRTAAVLMLLLRAWPRLLTQGARWGGKVRTVDLVDANALAGAWPRGAPQSVPRSSLTHPQEEPR